jgi:small GTP-binding protein
MAAYRKLTLKLILVGSSGVGKTSLVTSFFKQKFEAQIVSTVSPAFCNAPIEIDPHTTVDLQIWDTAGQEQYQSISQMFYRESHIAFICYDRDEVGSVARWVARVREHAPDAKLFLVATKADLLTEEGAEGAMTREGVDRATELNAKYFLTSSLTGRNVFELFESAARETALGNLVMRKHDGGGPAKPPPPPPTPSDDDKCC